MDDLVFTSLNVFCAFACAGGLIYVGQGSHVVEGRRGAPPRAVGCSRKSREGEEKKHHDDDRQQTP